MYRTVFLQWEFHVPNETELLNLAFFNVLNTAPSYLTPHALRQISTLVDEVTEVPLSGNWERRTKGDWAFNSGLSHRKDLEFYL